MSAPRPAVIIWARLRSLFSSLSLRIFLWLAGLSVLAFATYTYVNIRTTSELWQQTVLASAQRFSDLIQRSTHHSMLLNRKQDVRYVIQTIARQPGVDGVRIYDKQGFIMLSADSEEIGRQVDLKAEACVICHDKAKLLQSVPADNRMRIYRSERGDRHRVLGLINPIENLPDCSAAACHAHPPEQTILGVLDVKMSMAEADMRLEATRRQAILAAVVLVLLIGVSSAAFIDRVVRRPVRRLIEGSQRVARGDLNGRIDVSTHDEIGQLGHAFNDMTQDLQQAREEIVNWSHHLERMVVDKTEELEGALKEIQDLERRKSHFMRISAHQLRSPLATIKTSAQVLTEGYVDPGSARGRKILRGAAERVDGLLAIINELLELAKIREGHAKAPWTINVDVREMLQDILRRAKPTAQKQGIRLVPNTMDAAVLSWGVPSDLRFALENVVDNAIKYSHAGGEVRVNLESSREHATLTVADQGIGIPVELQRDVFLEFVRAPNAKHHAHQGTGLGLTIVKEAVEMHGGRVSLQSRQNLGTTVIVKLVLQNALPHEVRRGMATEKAEEESQA
jgi:two-component system NtrC family sensor kinase